jgi:hypothetical protein
LAPRVPTALRVRRVFVILVGVGCIRGNRNLSHGPPCHVFTVVVGLRPELHMLRVDAQTVVALVADHASLRHRHPLNHTENKPVVGPLAAFHLRLGIGGRGV